MDFHFLSERSKAQLKIIHRPCLDFEKIERNTQENLRRQYYEVNPFNVNVLRYIKSMYTVLYSDN